MNLKHSDWLNKSHDFRQPIRVLKFLSNVNFMLKISSYDQFKDLESGASKNVRMKKSLTPDKNRNNSIFPAELVLAEFLPKYGRVEWWTSQPDDLGSKLVLFPTSTLYNPNQRTI